MSDILGRGNKENNPVEMSGTAFMTCFRLLRMNFDVFSKSFSDTRNPITLLLDKIIIIVIYVDQYIVFDKQ